MSILLGLIGIIVLIVGGLILFTAWTAVGVERRVPPLGRFMRIDGMRLHYLDAGSGQPIVMIHGLGSQMRSFTYSLFAKMTGDYRVVLIDRPGSGYSRRSAGASARLPAQAETIAKVIQALKLERPVVVGHSLGGAVALALALNHPEQVGGLALVAPLTHPQDEPPAALRGLAIQSPIMRWLVAWTVATPSSIAGREALIESLFGPDPVPRDFGTKGGGLLSLRPKSFVNASRDMAAVGEDLPGMVARYSTLTMPVGVLFGSGDRILDPNANGAALQAKVPGAELDLIDAGGHMTPLSAPDRCAAFIARIAGRARGERS